MYLHLTSKTVDKMAHVKATPNVLPARTNAVLLQYEKRSTQGSVVDSYWVSKCASLILSASTCFLENLTFFLFNFVSLDSLHLGMLR